ncbi:MAG: hypothetical protein AB7R40_23260 [Nitrospiraceae bacterium]
MARFYASIQGARGEATRMGSVASGISGHIRGWDVGVRVEGVSAEGVDAFNVFATFGSNGGGQDVYLGQVIRGPAGPAFIPAAK